MKPTNDQVAREWREAILLQGPYSACANQAGALGDVRQGEAGGMFVECHSIGRRAYLKPRRRDPDPANARAAREKIASDLAHDLGVNVPPALLTTRANPEGEEPFVCLTLVMHPRQWSWEQVRFNLSGPQNDATALLLAALPRAAARALVLDTWVGQTDHNDHPHNIVFGYDPVAPEQGEYVFLDYAFSLGIFGTWAAGRHLAFDAAPFPPRMLQALDTGEVSATLSALEGLNRTAIEEVVNRVPDTHLVPEQRSLIATCLCERQPLVRAALAPYLPGGAA